MLARLWAALAGLGAGTTAGPRAPWWAWALACVAGAVGLCFRRRPAAAIAGLVVVAAGAGALSATLRDPRNAALADMARSVPRCEVSGVVMEPAGGFGTLVRADVASCRGFGALTGAGPLLLESGETDAAGAPVPAGAPILASGWLVPLGEDSFAAARRRLGAPAVLTGAQVHAGEARGVRGLAAHVRAGLESAAQPHGTPGALVRGLVIGDTSGIDYATIATLRAAGLSHLLAVSGSNLAIVLGTIALATRGLWLAARLAAAAAGLVAFVLVVGPEPSVMRAASMGAVGLAALAAGARARPLNALALALIVVVGLRPAMVGSVGLHLSAAATAGIVLWARPLQARLDGLARPVSGILAATLAAQLAVAPILVAAFGELSVSAPLANLLAVPAVPVATVVGLVAGISDPVIPGAGRAAAAVAALPCRWILLVGRVLGSPGWATVELPAIAALPLAAAVAIMALQAVRRAA